MAHRIVDNGLSLKTDGSFQCLQCWQHWRLVYFTSLVLTISVFLLCGYVLWLQTESLLFGEEIIWLLILNLNHTKCIPGSCIHFDLIFTISLVQFPPHWGIDNGSPMQRLAVGIDSLKSLQHGCLPKEDELSIKMKDRNWSALCCYPYGTAGALLLPVLLN